MIRPYGSLAHELFAFRSLLQQSPALTSVRLVANTVAARDSNPEKLPRLPVPKLNDTLTKYLKTVEPHLSNEEFNVTKTLVSQFGADGGIGYKLQGLLEKRAQQLDNWLADWWVHTAYLDFRWPVTVHSNPGLVFPLQQFKDQNEQLKYAATTIHGALNYKQLVDSDGIPTEKMGKSPLDMSQYKKVFGTCRIPGVKRDRLSFNDSKHIIVFHRGHIFKMPVWGQDGILLNEQQIIDQLKEIIASSRTPCSDPIGVLTSENRNTWGKAFEELIKDKSNRSHLKLIEESLFVLCLDEAVGLSKAPTKSEKQTIAAAQTIHGGGSESNGCNRWFDKTLQIIVGADGVVGLTYEHSPAEGQPIAIMTDHIVNYIAKNTPSTAASSSVLKAERLDFNVSSNIKNVINVAKSNIDKMVEDLELNCFTYDKYGKDFIKSNKLSPDSYIQMAMQYAFYRLHKVPAAHYESAATRLYIGGRTETIRSCSNESVAFAKCMLNGSSSPKEKFKALETAIKAHKDYSLQAVQGFGVDRHLLGLKLIAIENGMDIPKLYLDTGFTKSAHMRISSSQVASKCDAFMAYGPLVPDGYATCYNPRAKDMNFGTAAFNSHPDTSCDKYRKSLEDSLQDMHDVLLMNPKSKL